MSPIRLLILAVLFYIAWRLLRGLGKDSSPGRRSGKQGNSKVQDVLVEDPVCHTLVPKHQALTLRHKGTTYYFCSARCRQAFERDSDHATADE